MMGKSKRPIAEKNIEFWGSQQLINMNLKNKYPQFIMGRLAQAKNGYKQFWKPKIHAANG